MVYGYFGQYVLGLLCSYQCCFMGWFFGGSIEIIKDFLCVFICVVQCIDICYVDGDGFEFVVFDFKEIVVGFVGQLVVYFGVFDFELVGDVVILGIWNMYESVVVD